MQDAVWFAALTAATIASGNVMFKGHRPLICAVLFVVFAMADYYSGSDGPMSKLCVVGQAVLLCAGLYRVNEWVEKRANQMADGFERQGHQDCH